MPQVAHQRDLRCAIIWGNTAKPDIAGSLTAVDFDKTTSITALTSQALPVEGFTYFNRDIKTRRVNRQTGKRHRSTLDTWNDTKGSTPGVTLSMPATKETLDLFLAMAFQRVTEGATTPFVKAYAYPDATQTSWSAGRYPDFEADEGHFCGLVMQSNGVTFANYEEIMVGCVPTQLRITCASDEHDGQLWLEADMIGRFLDMDAYTGTVTAASVEPSNLFHINDLGVRTILDTATVPIYGFGFTIDTGLRFVPFGGTGGGGSTNLVMSGPHTSGFVDFLADDTGLSPYTLLRDGVYATGQFSNASNQIAWGDGTTDAAGDLDFTWRGQATAENCVPVGNEETRFRWNFDCAEYSSNDAFKVNFANALDRGW